MRDLLSVCDAREIVLREYQEQAVDGLRAGIRSGLKRQILCAGTGAGKTVMAAHLMKQAARKSSYSLFLVDRVSLVDQTSAVFDQYGIEHGVVQADHPRWAPYEHVQVCSIQTLAKRKLPRDPSLIIYDEAHVMFKSAITFMDWNPDAVCIGLTATPFTAGLGNHWGGMVNVRTTRALIDDGFLVEPKIYVGKSPDDSEYARNSFGEYSDESAASAGIRIVGDVLTEWTEKTREHFGRPVKTIVFSPTVEHGREICATFRAAGYNFQQISYLDKDDDERRAKIAEFRKPDSDIIGLVSCGVLTRGFDVPEVLCGISCKPYRKSLSSHIQEIGRVMRPSEGKKYALWLDHVGNVERFALDLYDFWENGAGDLSHATKKDSTPRERNEQVREKLVCPECAGALRGNVCTCCGWERPARSGIHAVEGEMQEFDIGSIMNARPGLRAACLKEPRAIWDAALSYTMERSRKGEDAARRWAAGIWHGVYPDAKLPSGWYGATPRGAGQDAYALIEREVKRYRKTNRRAV